MEVGGIVEPHQGHAVLHTQAEGGVGSEAPLAGARMVEQAVGEEAVAELDVFHHRFGFGVALGEGLQRGDEALEVGGVAIGVAHVLAARGGGGNGGEHLCEAAHLGVALHLGLHGVAVHRDQPLLQLAVETGVHRLEFFQHLGVLLLAVFVAGGAVHVFQQLVGQPFGGELDGLGFLGHEAGHQHHRDHQGKKSALHI